MDVRIKQAVRLSAALDILIIGVAAVAAVMLTQTLAATGYLFLLPIALLWCGFPALAAVADWVIVSSKARAGRMSFIFNYLIITRLILLGVSLGLYYKNYIDDPLHGTSYLWLYAAAFIAVLVTGLWSVGLIFRAMGKSRIVQYSLYVLLSFLMLTTLAYLVYVVNFSPSAALFGKGSRTDKQTEYDIYLLRQDVWSFYIEEKKLPVTLTQAISKPQSYGAAIPSDRRSTYEYKPNADGKQYDICANFATDTSYKNTSNSPENSHKAGYFCVHYNNNK